MFTDLVKTLYITWIQCISLQCTCIPPDPEAAASVCQAALPCFASIFQSLISREMPSLVQVVYNAYEGHNTEYTMTNMQQYVVCHEQQTST